MMFFTCEFRNHHQQLSNPRSPLKVLALRQHIYWLTWVDFWGQMESLDLRNTVIIAALKKKQKNIEGWMSHVAMSHKTSEGTSKVQQKAESIAGNVRTACHSGVCDEVYLISKVTVDVVYGVRMKTAALHPLLPECLLLTFFFLSLFTVWVWNLGFRAPLKNTLYFISPNYAIFQNFHFRLVQFGKETLCNDVYTAVSPLHHVTIGTVSKQTERSIVLCAGCIQGNKDTDI